MGQICSCFAGLRRSRCCVNRAGNKEEQYLLEQVERSIPSPQIAAEAATSTEATAGDQVSASAEPCAGMCLTRPVRSVPPRLESDESSSEEDEIDTPSGKWFARVAELGPDGLPSIGSAEHAEGNCKRCCFFPKGRCQNGHDCRFCHFDHEKRKRLKKKKKRGSGSELPTPSSAAGSLITPGANHAGALSGTPLGSMLGMMPPLTPLGLNSMPLTPMGQAPMTPMSPSAPPMGPPQLAALAEAEPPPPPAEEPQLPVHELNLIVQTPQTAPAEVANGALPSASSTRPTIDTRQLSSSKEQCTGSAGQPPATPSSAPIPQTPLRSAVLPPVTPTMVSGTAANLTGKPVTLTDLIVSPTTAPPQAPPQAQVPIWPPADGLHSAVTNGWPAGMWNSYEYYAALGAPPAGFPPYPAPSTPAVQNLPKPAEPPSAGLDKDSPRSVVLTLCGAWGALKTQKGDKPARVRTGAGWQEPPTDLAAARFARADLLGFRKVTPGGHKPGPLKSLRVYTMQ